MSEQGQEMQELRTEVARLQAAALESDRRHADEMASAQRRHDDETFAAKALYEEQIRNLDAALASRDVIGQAKGIIMATLHCDADTAFDLLRKQSQCENRKLVEIAAEIARGAAHPDSLPDRPTPA